MTGITRITLLVFLGSMLTAFLVVPAPSVAGSDDFRGFRQRSTEHFTFVYEPRDAAAAEELVAMAEEVYRDVTTFLEYAPEHTRVLVIGRTDRANGYFSSAPPQHIALIVTPPEGLNLGTRHREWLRLVFVHEFTHYVHLNYDTGFFSGLSRLFGEEVITGNLLFMPFWNVEGITTTAESLLTAGGRGKSAFFELPHRALVMENELFSLTQAGYQSHLPPRGRYYVGGYLLINYIVREYGIETYLDIHRDYLRFPFFGIYGAVRRNTGKSAAAILREVRRELERTYESRMEISQGRLITPNRVGDYYLPLSAGDQLVLYRRRPDARGAIILLDPETGAEEVLATVPLSDGHSLTAAADASTIIFSAFESTGSHPAGSLLFPGETVAHLYRLNAETGEVVRLPDTAHFTQPAISPDGTSVVAVERRGASTRLVTFPIDNPGGKRVLHDEPQSQVGSPSFSPSGRQIAFTVKEGGDQDIFTMDLGFTMDRGSGGDGDTSPAGAGRAIPVPGFSGSAEHFPRFHGNDRVIFSSDRTGSLALYEYDLREGSTGLVLRDPVGAYGGVAQRDRMIYGTHTAKGWALRATPVEELAWLEVPPEAAVPGSTTLITAGRTPGWTPPESGEPTDRPAEAIEGADAGVEAGRPYRDIPRPELWFPWYVAAAGADGGLGVGPAAQVYGASLLARWDWRTNLGIIPGFIGGASGSTGGTFDPAVQPIGSVQLGYSRGPWSLQYRASNSYSGSSGTATQVVGQSLGVNRSLVRRERLGIGTNLILNSALVYQTVMTGVGNFGFYARDAFNTAGRSMTHRVSVYVGRTVVGAAEEFHGATGNADASLGASYVVPLLQGEFTGVAVQGNGRIFGPGLAATHASVLEVRGYYSTGAPLTARPYAVQPRDTRVAVVGPSPLPVIAEGRQGNLLGHLGYRLPIARVDMPLFLGTGIVGFAANFYAEGALAFDVWPVGVDLDPGIVLGSEIVTLFESKSVSVPVGIGTSVRLNPRTLLDEGVEMRPYVFVDFALPTETGGGYADAAARSLYPNRPEM